MFDDCKSKVLQLKAMGSALIGNRLERVRFARVGRWLPATALLVIAGCSWFEEEPTPPAPSQQAKATPPAPGEGEAMAGEEAKTPDINSVPNEAPKPSIVNLDQAQDWERLPVCDLVMIRNVLIYFDQATKAEILQRCADHLRPDGYLFLGSSETPLNVVDRFVRVPTEATICYRPA